MFKLSARSKRNRIGVDPKLIEISDLAIQITKIDFGVPEDGGIRTAIRQNELFRDEKSKADGFENLSEHQPADDGYGKALDFYAFIDGSASWQHEHLAMVAAAHLQAASILGYKIEWGGLWMSTKKTNGIPYGWDMAHIQLVKS